MSAIFLDDGSYGNQGELCEVGVTETLKERISNEVGVVCTLAGLILNKKTHGQ